ncbi:carnosine N-methyltransferase [Malassezia sp. CBS 17886]|nr:carnosine N-methyltransferase [Malassezia sp. CBS 17886]
MELHRHQDLRAALCSLPRQHQALLQETGIAAPLPPGTDARAQPGTGVRARIGEMDDRVRRNADVLEQIRAFCETFLGVLGGDGDTQGSGGRAARGPAEPARTVVAERDQDRVRTAMRQLARDWSDEGHDEREAAYGPLLRAVDEAAAHRSACETRVLVPGAGMGRLAWELAARGYRTQGNEFSYYMLLPTHFILNNTQRVHEHTLFPHIYAGSNWRSANDMLRPVRVPDVLPSTLPDAAELSMVAGEFVEVYAKPEETAAWDVVVTCYFIDTAKNLLRYVEVINHVLPVGGVWVNSGPLLWHFEHESTPSVEFTLEEVLAIVLALGFEIVEQRTLSPQRYTAHPHSMLSYLYEPEMWVCRKVRDCGMAPVV